MNKLNTVAPSNHCSSHVKDLLVRIKDIKFLLVKSICVWNPSLVGLWLLLEPSQRKLLLTREQS